MENKEIMNEEEINEVELTNFDDMEYDYEPEGPSMAAVGGTVAGIGALGVLGFIAGKKLAPKAKAKVAKIKEDIADRKAMNAALKENKRAFVEAWKSKKSIPDANDETSDPVEEAED